MAGKIRELMNGRIIDVERGCYHSAGTRLLTCGDRIQAVLAPGDACPEGAESVDLGGLAAIPGLMNTHCHIQLTYPSPLAGLTDLVNVKRFGEQQILRNMLHCQRRGVLHLRDALQGDQRPNRRLRERIQNGEVPGPRIYQAVLVAPVGGTFSRPTSLFDRLTAIINGSTIPSNDSPESGIVKVQPDASAEQVRRAVDLAIDGHGAQSIKIYDQEETVPGYKPGAQIFRQAQLNAAADQARKRGIACTMHHSTAAGFRRGVQAGVTSLAHLPCDELLTDIDLENAHSAGVILEPTLTVAYFMAWRLAGSSYLNHPLYRWLAKIRDESYVNLVETFWLPKLGKATLDLPLKVEEGRTRLLGMIDISNALLYWGRMAGVGIENLQDLYASGVPIAIGTDAGAVPISPAAIGLEVRLLCLFLHGFDGCQALKAATLTSAKAMGIDKEFGTLEAGKIADIALLHGDPLGSSEQLGRLVQGLILGGEMVFWSGKKEMYNLRSSD